MYRYSGISIAVTPGIGVFISLVWAFEGCKETTAFKQSCPKESSFRESLLHWRH